MIDSTLSISAPAYEGVFTVIREIPESTETLSLDVVNLPLKFKSDIPFELLPLVTRYDTSKKFGSWSAIPNTPSPKINSYLSSSI